MKMTNLAKPFKKEYQDEKEIYAGINLVEEVDDELERFLYAEETDDDELADNLPVTEADEGKQEKILSVKEETDAEKTLSDKKYPMAVTKHYKTKSVHEYIAEGGKEINLKAMRYLEEEFRKKNLNLPMIEAMIREQTEICFKWGDLYAFNGITYEVLSEEKFLEICVVKLPAELQEKLRSMKILEEAYKYLYVKTKACGDKDVSDFVKFYRNYIVFENCVIDAETLELYQHSPDVFVPGMIHAKYLDEDVETPVMDAFLETMTGGDQEAIYLIWQIIVYFLLLNLPPVRAFFWLGTVPGSGKSVFINFIRDLLGTDQVCSVPADEIGSRFARATLKYSPINLAAESTGILSLNCVNMIKNLTGDPIINIERKGIDREDIVNRTKIMFASNNPICIGRADRSTAFWDRLEIVPCVGSVPPDKMDKFLGDKLKAEKDAIVTKAVRMFAEDLISSEFEFVEPRVAAEMKAEWQESTLDDCDKFYKYCIVKADKKDFVPAQELVVAYREYTGDEEMTVQKFGTIFHKRFPEIRKDKKKLDGHATPVSCYFGIRLNDELVG